MDADLIFNPPDQVWEQLPGGEEVPLPVVKEHWLHRTTFTMGEQAVYDFRMEPNLSALVAHDDRGPRLLSVMSVGPDGVDIALTDAGLEFVDQDS